MSIGVFCFVFNFKLSRKNKTYRRVNKRLSIVHKITWEILMLVRIF